MSLVETIYGDTWVMTHLCVFDSLDGEPLPKWSGPIRELNGGPALTVSRSENESGWSVLVKRRKKKEKRKKDLN